MSVHQSQPPSKKRVEVSVARYLRTPPYTAKRKDFDLGTSTAYAATATRALLSLATMQWPDNGGTMPNSKLNSSAPVEPNSPPPKP
ncbi:hypothetical protein BOSEA1005_13060 [Hyphomicrobiales bacterium]|nr:hypothetical protein BOSEA1005_13060 [Hyphomicrobiales bacterium]CAI0343764.1 hypothetical protein BO1005MUT1_290100 [Hyphomicrobiales bacterium]